MATTLHSGPAQPLGEINTTPLIDVMLVLLIMFVITIPAATHALPVDLPSCADADCPEVPFDPVRNRLTLDSGDRLLWNGSAIDGGQLAAILAETRRMPVEPELQFAPDAQAGYAASAQTLLTIKSSGVTRFGFVGNERFRAFGRAGAH
jgi:biopolymer transport protein ExbD